MTIEEANQALRLFDAHMISHLVHVGADEKEVYQFFIVKDNHMQTVGYADRQVCDVEPFYKAAVELYL